MFSFILYTFLFFTYQFFNLFFASYLFVISIYADVTEPLLIEVDQIYHLACPASPIFYKYNPVKVCIFSPNIVELQKACEDRILTLNTFSPALFLSLYFSILFSLSQEFQEQNMG